MMRDNYKSIPKHLTFSHIIIETITNEIKIKRFENWLKKSRLYGHSNTHVFPDKRTGALTSYTVLQKLDFWNGSLNLFDFSIVFSVKTKKCFITYYAAYSLKFSHVVTMCKIITIHIRNTN